MLSVKMLRLPVGALSSAAEMNRSLGTLYRSTANAVRRNSSMRPVISARRYVDWTPDKKGNNKKGKLNNEPTAQQGPPPPPPAPSQSKPSQPVPDPKKAFRQAPTPPPPPPGQSTSSTSS